MRSNSRARPARQLHISQKYTLVFMKSMASFQPYILHAQIWSSCRGPVVSRVCEVPEISGRLVYPKSKRTVNNGNRSLKSTLGELQITSEMHRTRNESPDYLDNRVIQDVYGSTSTSSVRTVPP